jgi:N-acetylglucosaminyldiphosphoundecaprenol N-acetyl-beta-D-mannosaminyltransferase
MNKFNILGIKIDHVSLNETLAFIHQFIDSGKPHQICTVNIEFINEALTNKPFFDAINKADLALADGAGIVLSAKILSHKAPEKISGVDLTYKLCEEAAKQGYRIFMLGGQNEVGNKAAEILKSLYPGLNIVGVYEGNPNDNNIISKIQDAKPHILLVAWGAPKQDLWIAKHKDDLNVPIMMGVGGTYDFIAGLQIRAPKTWRDFGFEWLWRLIHEPWRWKRQLALPKVIFLVFLQKIGLNK